VTAHSLFQSGTKAILKELKKKKKKEISRILSKEKKFTNKKERLRE